MEPIKQTLLLVVAFSVIVSTLLANVVEHDEYWHQQAALARRKALDSYHPNPAEVVTHLNKEVRKVVHGTNSTRRQLMKYRGPCKATNPIDRCWRCDRKWAKHRQKMAQCAPRFGRPTTGGLGGPYYVVNDPSDKDMVNPKPGTLRHAVTRNGPLWITFACDMQIILKQELLISSDKTIDGRGAKIHICRGGQLTLQNVHNVIISNIHIHHTKPLPGGLIRDSENHTGFRTVSEGDGISLFTASKVMLFGGNDKHTQDKIMQLTMAFNHFGRGLVQRIPRIRFGFVHIMNNYYNEWVMYAIGGNQKPTILSQGNRFMAPNTLLQGYLKEEFTTEDMWRTWDWRSQGDVMVNGAYFAQSGKPIKGVKRYNVIKPKSGSNVRKLTRFAGVLDCRVGKQC